MGRRAWQFTAAPCSQFLASTFKPIPQPQRRQTVVPVVALDRLEQFADFPKIVPKRHCGFVRLKSEIRILERYRAGKFIEWFESLDGIALDRDSNALTDGAVEIDEDSCP